VAVPVLVTMLAAVTLMAAEKVRLRDGTVIEVESYRLTGSYINLTFADGRQIAYDIADVDLESLKRQDTGPAVSGEAEGSEPTRKATFSEGLSLGIKERRNEGVAITDEDVVHVRPSAGGAGTEGGEQNQGPPPGYQEGGMVLAQHMTIEEAGEGQWSISGQVVNRLSRPVQDVRVELKQTNPSEGQEPWSDSFFIAASLNPNDPVKFDKIMRSPQRPVVKVTVMWMEAPAPPGRERVVGPGGAELPSAPRGARGPGEGPAPQPTPRL
jgi:hypothetical protein